jgi:hypothetical protein
LICGALVVALVKSLAAPDASPTGARGTVPDLPPPDSHATVRQPETIATQPDHDRLELTGPDRQAWQELTGDSSAWSNHRDSAHGIGSRETAFAFFQQLAAQARTAAERLMRWIALNSSELLTYLDDLRAGRQPAGLWGALRFLINFAPTFSL